MEFEPNAMITLRKEVEWCKRVYKPLPPQAALAEERDATMAVPGKLGTIWGPKSRRSIRVPKLTRVFLPCKWTQDLTSTE